jgi:hypothetical protein
MAVCLLATRALHAAPVEAAEEKFATERTDREGSESERRAKDLINEGLREAGVREPAESHLIERMRQVGEKEVSSGRRRLCAAAGPRLSRQSHPL